MPPFHVMVKPVGSTCNLRCDYCYYLPKEQLLHQRRGARMSPALLESYIRQTLENHPGPEVGFSWQGGEPTLAGLDYFRQIIVLQQRYRQVGQTLRNDLQTNGTLLDDAWCEFLVSNDFLLGLSIDGPAPLHDSCRKDRKGQATHAQVMRAARLLQRYRIPFSTLTVVGRHNAHAASAIYHFLSEELGARMIQLIPCVEPGIFATTAPQHWPTDALPFDDDPAALAGFVSEHSVRPAQWGRFLCEFFDCWLKDGLGHIMVNLFESAVLQLLGYPALVCSSAERCGHALALEQDGGLYACDHYVYPEYRLGDITQQGLAYLAHSVRQQAFGAAKREQLAPRCLHCPYLSLCWGECPRNRFVRSRTGQTGLNYLCPGIRQFFTHAGPALQNIAAHVARQQARR